ncbi:hypothetical protein CMQ_245 [Grosmannia clavigera kw1407]|uniref:Uncharacterized protein n=1 Tax=Grosmannia clavigera (strain kw1407 / UAMH 11150) TaxID=655863 RepID=F0XRE6_GROCL|nr:uncharacterized protein CMQ_245 [Grosmannia clavigera kw1407]EFW99927.1 hypothetical protein CMQ_245 [Grosmannia clavigera kw1407]
MFALSEESKVRRARHDDSGRGQKDCTSDDSADMGFFGCWFRSASAGSLTSRALSSTSYTRSEPRPSVIR